MELKTIQDCEKALLAFVPPPRSQRQKYNLRNIRAFMEAIGDPQNSYQVIHVAGTSGKTSTCYYTAALLSASGKKTGLSVSPHITKVSERVQINMSPASDELFASELSEFLVLVKVIDIPLTYFEILIAFAYWFFARQEVDVAVIETGLGGLLDGSNVVLNPYKVCVLTDIGMDHTAILGNTIPHIAAQKAGIIGEKNEVFAWNQSKEVLSVFKNASKSQHAKIHILQAKSDNLPADMPLFQKRNFQLAEYAVTWTLKHRLKGRLSLMAIRKAVKQVIPARMERIQEGGFDITMDGAHNPQKMKALIESYKSLHSNKPPAVLFSCIEGPDSKIEQTIAELLKLQPSRVIITAFQSLQDIKKISAKPKDLQKIFFEAGYTEAEIIFKPVEALEYLKKSYQEILVTGSLYLIFDIRNTVLAH